MTVRELIEKLQELDQDKDILIEGYMIGEIELCDDVNGRIFYTISSKVEEY